MVNTALYVIIHEDDTDPCVEPMTVDQLWQDPRCANRGMGAMLSAIRLLHRHGVARDTLAPMILVLGSIAVFRQQLVQWYRATALPLADQKVMQSILGWQHPLGDNPDDALLRALWTYLVEAGGEEIVNGVSPDDFSCWVTYSGYPWNITALGPLDPTPEDPDVTVVSDMLTGRDFVLSI